MILNNANTIDNDQNQIYIDFILFLIDAFEMHVIITTRNSIAQEMTELKTITIEK